MGKTMEGAVTNAEAREAFVGHLKDTALDFILKILPAINIEQVGGNDNGCEWEISDISFTDFSLKKENVHIALGNFTNTGEELLRISAWDISSHFRKLKVSVKQTHFPNIQTEGLAEANAEKMAVTVGFKLQPGPAGQQPCLVMSSRSVVMESLDLIVSETKYEKIINALCFLFTDVLKGYACEKIVSQLDEHMGALVGALNAVLSACAPWLKKIGITLPEIAEPEPSPFVQFFVQKEEMSLASDMGAALGRNADEFIEIDWADPGRSFAVRV